MNIVVSLSSVLFQVKGVISKEEKAIEIMVIKIKVSTTHKKISFIIKIIKI